MPVTGEIDNETATKIEATLGKLILENDAHDTAVAVKEIQKTEKGGTKLKKKRDYVGYLMYFLKILVPTIVAVFILRGFS